VCYVLLEHIDFGLGFDDEEGVGVGVAVGAEFLAGIVEGGGLDGEDDFAVGAADEVEAEFLLDDLEWGRHLKSREILRFAQNDNALAGATGGGHPRKDAPTRIRYIGSIHRIAGRINWKIERRERNFEGGDRKLDLYQIGTEAAEGEAEEVGGEIAAEGVTAKAEGGEERGAGAGEGVEDEVAFMGGGEEDAFEEGDGLLRGMLAEFFLPGFGRTDFPDGLHLFAAIDFLHELVVEGVAGLDVFGGPDDGFGGVGEIAAREIGRRIGLDPGDVVEELEAELLHGEADGMDDVGGAGDPEGAVGF